MQRVRQLDVLRATAIVLVLLQHYGTEQLLTHRIGWTGVDLFFVLSGFLVSGLLFRELDRHGDVEVGRFLARRGFKIYPAFWAMLATTVLLRFAYHEALSLRALACELLFVQNYGPGLWVPTWSLAVEEHFYLLLALSFFVYCHSGRQLDERRGIRAVLALLVGVFVLRVVTELCVPVRYKMTSWGTHVRIDSLAFGTLLSYLHHRHFERLSAFVRRGRVWLMLGGTALVSHVLFFDAASLFVRTIGFTLLYLGYGALMLVVLFTMKAADPFSRLLAAIGRSSYGIYIWHLPVQRLVVDKLVAHGWLSATIATRFDFFVLTSILSGMALTTVIERPFLALRDRIVAPRSAASLTQWIELAS